MEDILDRVLDSTSDFYSVEYDHGEMIVTPLGYIYCAGCSVTDDPTQIYRWEEYHPMVFSIEDLRECGFDPEQDEDFQCRKGDYMTDLSRPLACEKLLELMAEMGSERHCVPYDRIEEGLEAGLYYNGTGLIW